MEPPETKSKDKRTMKKSMFPRHVLFLVLLGDAFTGHTNAATPPTLAARTAYAKSGAKVISVTFKPRAVPPSGSYVLERKAGAGSYTLLATLPANKLDPVFGVTFEDPTFDPSIATSYRVRESGASVFSNEATVILNVPPVAPTDLNAITNDTITGNLLELTWRDNSNNEWVFDIEVLAGSWVLIGSVQANGFFYVPGGVIRGEAPITYTFRIRARNAAGVSAYSNLLTTTPNRSPAAPSNLFAYANFQGTVDLSWQDNSDCEAIFDIEVFAGSWVQIGSVGSGYTGYHPGGTQYGTAYTFRVKARNWHGSSSYSNESSCLTYDPTKLRAAPTNLTAMALGNGVVQLAWQDNTGGQAGVFVERADAVLQNGRWAPNGGTLGYAVYYSTFYKSTSLQDSVRVRQNPPLQVGKTYFYRVKNTASDREMGSYSNEVFVTVK